MEDSKPTKIRVCCSRSCTAFGAKSIMKAIKNGLGLDAGEKNEQYDVDYCGCLGWCSNSPNVELNDDKILMDCEPETVVERINKKLVSQKPKFDDELIKDDFLGDI